MRIYTSYFSNARTLQVHNVMIIGIALYPPRWLRVISLRQVAPTYSILKQTSSDEEYTRRYKAEVLSKVDIKQFVSDIQNLSGGRDVALCCFEKPGEFCHRHLLAERMNEYGYDVQEYEEPNKSTQLELEFE